MVLPFYRDRKTPLHRLHPAAKLAMVTAVVVASLVFFHPAYLLSLLAGTVILALLGRVEREWWAFMRLFLLIAATVVLINTLVNAQGDTVFWKSGDRIPGFGYLIVSLEGVLYGSMMALRLFAVVSAFTVLSLTVHPDEFTQLLARFAYRSGLAVSLSTRFYPAVVRDASAIVDAQRSRGLDLDSGGRLARVRKRMPVIIPLFHTSLERAVGTAEAMEARGFGSTGRTRWRRRGWTGKDSVACAASVALLGLTFILALFGDGAPSFYPGIDLDAGPTTVLASTGLMLLVGLQGAGPTRGSDGGDGRDG